MDMLELITLIQNSEKRPMMFCVHLEELQPIRCWKPEPEDVYYNRTHNPEPKAIHTFMDRDEVTAFLFDHDLFGWEVSEWRVEDLAEYFTTMTIKLYRFNY